MLIGISLIYRAMMEQLPEDVVLPSLGLYQLVLCGHRQQGMEASLPPFSSPGQDIPCIWLYPRSSPQSSVTLGAPSCMFVAGRRRRFEMGTELHDLIFLKGELYCIKKDGEVVAFDVSNNHASPPHVVVPTRHDCTALTSPFTYYLVESSLGDPLC